MRTKIPGIDVCPGLGQNGFDGLVHSVVGIDAIHAAPDAGLVGHNDDGDVPTIDRRDGLCHASDDNKILGIMQVLALFVDHPVAVEKKARLQASHRFHERSRALPTRIGRGQW